MKHHHKASSTNHRCPPSRICFGPHTLPQALVVASLSAALLGPSVLCFGGQPPVSTLRGERISALPSTNSAPAPQVPSASEASPRVVQTNAVVAAPNPSAPGKKEEFVAVGFETLSSFNFAGSEAPVSASDAVEASRKVMAQIPVPIKALNEKQVAVRGFMLPMKFDHGMVTDFLLLKTQMGCCFGLSPGINEWIDVRTAGKGVKPLMDDLITVYGTMHVGEVRENGYLTGLYKMDCERIQATQ